MTDGASTPVPHVQMLASTQVDAVVAIQARTTGPAWGRDDLLGDVARPDRLWLVALIDGAVVGCAGLSVVAGLEAEILVLGVDPAWQRRGIASALIADVLRRLDERGIAEVSLEVRSSNAAAKALYAGIGFAEVAVRLGYYADGEDALLLQRRSVQHEGEPG